MSHKPKIQYVGQFYVYGSEARALELQEQKKKAKTRLPKARLEKIENIYVDPVAMVGIAVALVMLVVMVFGAVQLQEDWVEYERMAGYVTNLKTQNAELTHTYRSGYSLDDIEIKALAMGMIPKSQLEATPVTVTLPEVKPVMTWDQKVVRFWNELWA